MVDIILNEKPLDYIEDLVNPYVKVERERLAVEAGFIPNRFFKRGDEGTLTPVGDMVIIKIAKTQDLMTAGGLVVPTSIAKNYRMVKGTILSVGPGVRHISPGMIVEFDQHATFNYEDEGCDTPDEIVATRQENIIFFIRKGKE